MNEFTILLYLLLFAATVGMTFAFMYTTMKSSLNEFNKLSKPKIHPEMKDVKNGEELLVFSMEDSEDDDDGGDIVIIRR